MTTQAATDEQALTKYRMALAHHDWYYDFSDDHSVYKAGLSQRESLRVQAKALDPTFVIWNSYCPVTMRVTAKG